MYVHRRLLKWINDARGAYPNLEVHLSNRTGTKTDAANALLSVRCLHNLCSHSSLGRLCVSHVNIRGLYCQHLSIMAWEQCCYFSEQTLGRDKSALSTYVCHIFDKIIAFLPLWCHLRGRMQPHTHKLLLLLLFLCFQPHDIKRPCRMRWRGTHVWQTSEYL